MLKKACLTLLAKTDIDHITIGRLCSLAGVNRSTFYRYYPDIYALYEKIEDEFCEVFTRQIPAENLRSPSVLLKELLKAVKDLPAQERDFFYRKRQNIIEKVMKYYHPLYVSYLKEVSADISESAAEYRFSALAGCIVGIVNTWVENGMKESPEELCELFPDIPGRKFL